MTKNALNDGPLYLSEGKAFHGKSAEQKLQELIDREELRELIAAYAQRVAHGVAIADLFTDDGVFVHSNRGVLASKVTGRAELDHWFGEDRAPDAEHPLPMIHNYLFEIDGDEARGVNANELRISENGQSIIASGYYHDRYRRVDGRWRFVERRIDFAHWVPIQQGWARPVGS